MFRTSGNIITKVIHRALQLPLIFIAIPCVLLGCEKFTKLSFNIELYLQQDLKPIHDIHTTL